MKDDPSGAATNGSVGFTGLLTVAFIVLKLCGVIDWSWVWVLSPLWIHMALALIIVIVLIIVSACKSRKK